MCAFICWQGGREYASLTSMPTSHYLVLVLGGLATLAAVLYWGASALAIAPVLAFFGWSLLALQPIQRDTECERRFTMGLAGLWGYLYLGWLPAFLVALSMSKMPGLVLAAGLGVALSDIGAFCTGKLLRGPALAARPAHRCCRPGQRLGGSTGIPHQAPVQSERCWRTAPRFRWPPGPRRQLFDCCTARLLHGAIFICLETVRPTKRGNGGGGIRTHGSMMLIHSRLPISVPCSKSASGVHRYL
jgi:hypothetical protein